MLRSASLTNLAAMAAVAVLGSPAAAADPDDDTVVVNGNGRGWIVTTVEDAGALAEPTEKSVRPAPARTCTQTMAGLAGRYASEAEFDSGAPPGNAPGGWVIRECSDGSLDTAWVAAQRPRVLATAEVLARRATNRLPLPLPEPSFEPRRASSAGPATLVAIPTWFYLDRWAPVTQRTSAGGVWASVIATPVSATWWPGDGSGPIRCAGPGRAWATPSSERPCRYTYRRSSAAEPGNAYQARVIVTWQISWRGSGGVGGALPLMQRQSTFPVAVAERQTVVTVTGDQ